MADAAAGDGAARDTVHGTCIALGEAGVLLRGAPGTGKSDLALRLIEDGARLVADDQVRLAREGDAVIARPPEPIAGMMEVNGLGLVRLDGDKLALSAALTLLVDLAGRETIERLPPPSSEVLLGIALPRIALVATEASAPAKLRLAAGRGSGSIMPVP